MAAIFECIGVTKLYGGLRAVKDVSFAVEEGEIFAVVGPNGAGKTTLFDSISGISPATAGVVRFQSQDIQNLRPHKICHLGVARTFQTTVAFDTQTVLTNVLVGGVLGRRGESSKPTLIFKSDDIEAALDALELCDLLDKQEAQAAELSGADRKRLMLATALSTRPTLLLLDEPIGGLNRSEREEMVQLVKKVNRSGMTVLMIEHVMKAVQALAHRMLVLHHGEVIAEGPPVEVLRDERVIEIYLGGQGREKTAGNGGGGS